MAAEPQRRSESTRIDTFVDGAFAFSITLLVISGANLPADIAALEHALRGIPAFVACFAQLAAFWYGHVRWRDTARLTDGVSLVLSLLLVCFALIFVFPLHLVYASLFNSMTLGALSPDFPMQHSSVRALAALFVCYGLSYACMAGTLAALFRHGVRRAALSREEKLAAGVNVAVWGYCAIVGLLSVLIALAALATGWGWLIPTAGFSYALLSVVGVVANRSRARMQQEQPA